MRQGCVCTIIQLCIYLLPVFLLSHQVYASNDYKNLTLLFEQWRKFERPPVYRGAPDYREKTFIKRDVTFQRYKKRLQGIDYKSWPIAQQVDWYILLAEMNGYDFNERILKPWARDPAFYKTIWASRSDVPAHEGPTHHALTELWTYRFPLSQKEQQRLLAELSVIEPLMKQAQKNLTGNARELWIAGIRDIKKQSAALENIKKRLGGQGSDQLKHTINAAQQATDALVAWLEQQASTKTGPSGIGKENYNWYLRHVQLVPLSWQDEVRLLKRELDRAWSSLKLEEHRNRHLPALKAVNSEQQYNALAERSVKHFMHFLRTQEIITVADYFEPALRKHIGSYVPEHKRNFFTIGSHFDPTPLFTHFYHWFELARMDIEPHSSSIRQKPLLYNIFISHNEGIATAVEEMFMHAGLYDNNRRVREIVWIMMAQRAARGLGSLYAHANEITMEQAGNIHSEWTPRGWMKTELELLLFEQHLYLRQPGYGTSYITGKYLLERTLADYSKQREEQGKVFKLKYFFDELTEIGNIPMSLTRWQMTGLDNEIKQMQPENTLRQ